MAWAGWGAGPAGAGSSGGPSRAFLAVALVGSVVAAVALAADRSWGALVAAGATVYFALRLFGGLGRPRG